MVGCSWETPTAADESYEEYLRRREQLIFDRLLTPKAGPIHADAHCKAGCFDCEALWFGDTIRAAIQTHASAYPTHTTWIIEAPEPHAAVETTSYRSGYRFSG